MSTSTLPFDKLATMSNAEVNVIWQSILDMQRRRSCCFTCSRVTVQDFPEENSDWIEDVFVEMEVRGLPTKSKFKGQSIACPECHVDMVYEDRVREEKFLVCKPCGIRRSGGNHLDCRLGKIEAIPT